MSLIRFSPRHLASGLLLTAVLWGCDTQTPVEVPDTSQQARGSVVEDQVSQAAKQAALRPSGPAAYVPDPSPMFYGVQQIPFQAGPTNLANLGPVCDDCVMNDVPIGFNFTFYGNTYSTLQISSNGFVRFAPPNNDSGCCSGRPIPLNDLWNNIIAFAWTDLNPSGALGGRLRFETLGTAPNRRWVLHADSVRYFGGTETNLIQWLILHEGSNVIEIHTQLMTPRVITQGIENIDGTIAHFVPGRVATTFSLTNDGVRFTPEPVNVVPIHRVYSGDPPRGGDTISLADQWVYVEILSVQQYLGRPASPSDVRIGPTWETGTPAESFQLLDINNDGVLDIRVRFSRQALQDAGRLPLGTTTLVIWGRDPTTGELYRGERTVTVIPAPIGALCWDNGPFITHPNGGQGPIAGQHVSMSDPVNNTAGSNKLLIAPGPHFRVADDFTVGAGGCVVAQVITHGYQTGAAVPLWTSANLNIRSGSVTGPIVASATTTTWEFSGVYRTFNGVLNDANRPVYRLLFSFNNVSLAPGTYWIDWQVVGGASGWAPYVTLPDPAGGNNTQTVLINGLQLTPDGWVPDLIPPGAEKPFLVVEPGAQRLPQYGTPPSGPSLALPRDYSLWPADRAQ
jgi:hypothetical protein